MMQIANSVSELTQSLAKQLRGELMLSTAQRIYIVARCPGRCLPWSARKKRSRAGEISLDFRKSDLAARAAAAPQLPALAIQTPRQNQVLIRGSIDRVDVLPDGSACAIDYRTSLKTPSNSEIFHGISLQLLTALLLLSRTAASLPVSNSSRQLRCMFDCCGKLNREIRRMDRCRLIRSFICR